MNKRPHLANYLDQLQARGRITFTGKEAISKLGVSKIAFNRSAQRLLKKKRLLHPARGFYLIVPVEAQLSGAPDASWYIDDLMNFLEQPYYVGVLSAAAFHGAAHQAPQEFQVVTNSRLKPINVGRAKIHFLTKKWTERTPTETLKTKSGYIPISTPEATALDLIQYVRSAGELNNVATVLIELAEKIDPKKLLTSARISGEAAVAQRLGYLLDTFSKKRLTSDLHKWVLEQRPAFVALRPNWKSPNNKRDKKWSIIVNDDVEPDI